MKSNMVKNEEKIAVIIPVYKVDIALAEKCINSVITQTYQNMDIILVDDGNEKDYLEQLNTLANVDERIRVVSHEKNSGLFRARLTGVENVSKDAKYIAFVDADDSVTIDWFRLLYKSIKVGQADIAMGNTICEDENHFRYVFNRNMAVTRREPLVGKDIFDYLLKDCGLDFSNHTVWNKLYSKELWDRAWDDLNKIEDNLVMTEDIYFSFILFFYAEKMCFSNHDGYFYYRNSNSSTFSTNGFEKCKKNVKDLSLVFNELDAFLKKKDLYEEYGVYFTEWKNRYFRWWSDIVNRACSVEGENGEGTKKAFFDLFGKSEFENPLVEDSYMNCKYTKWNDKLENIKRYIVSDNCKVVSFDMFDTLLKRPVLYPEDVFELVTSETSIFPYEKSVIKKIRKLADEQARRLVHDKYPQYEDVTISEIYEIMHDRYDIPTEICDALKQKEVEIEREFAKKREFGYELYELASYVGKDVYVTSDMYIEKEDICKMLSDNGYDAHKEVLLSSEERLLKATGHLFDKLISVTNVKPEEIVHIGDNWNCDVVIPKKKGIVSFFIPKTKDILFNYLGDAYTGNSIGRAVDNTESIIDYSKHFDSLSVRSMYAVIANTMFDNPFVSFDVDSDYNGNPFYMGCMAVGMHMFGISKWLLDLVAKNKYRAIQFTSRDGFYLKRITDLFIEKANLNNVATNYLAISRKSLISIDICRKEFVNKIFVSCSLMNNTPESIINRYSSVLNPLDDNLVKKYKDAGFFMDRVFTSEDEFYRFLNLMAEIQYSDISSIQSIADAQSYFYSNVEKNDLVFDLGYSGKLHKSLVDALGFNVHGAYLSKDGYDAEYRIEENNMDIVSYYDFTPSMQGIINEYIFSDRGPSCIGYKKKDNVVEPVFDKIRPDYVGDYVVEEINRGAYLFVENFLDSFANRMDLIYLSPIDTCLQYEKMLVSMKPADLETFRCCMIEDEFFGGIERGSLLDIWNWQIKDRKLEDDKHVIVKTEYVDKVVTVKPENMEYEVYMNNVFGRNKLVKALYWFCVNKTFFKGRIKEYLKKEK